jgi:hypothetical protein
MSQALADAPVRLDVGATEPGTLTDAIAGGLGSLQAVPSALESWRVARLGDRHCGVRPPIHLGFLSEDCGRHESD